jgi:ubiquinone/menaquinone biosynthesis C-methylase UbiE
MELLAPKTRERPTERTAEYKLVLDCLELLRGRKILDVGVGPNPSLWYMLNTMGYLCTGSDLKMRVNEASQGPFIVDDITKTILGPNQYDAVFCISTLEHIPDYMKAVENMGRLVKLNGVVIMTFPFSREYIPNTVEGGYTQSFSWREIKAMQEYLPELFNIEYWKCWTGKHWRDGEREKYPLAVNIGVADLIGVVCKNG